MPEHDASVTCDLAVTLKDPKKHMDSPLFCLYTFSGGNPPLIAHAVLTISDSKGNPIVAPQPIFWPHLYLSLDPEFDLALAEVSASEPMVAAMTCNKRGVGSYRVPPEEFATLQGT